MALMSAGLEQLVGKVAGVSVGVVNGVALLDLDSRGLAEVDFNVVGTDAGTYVELQGTAEGVPFDRARVDPAGPRERRARSPVRSAGVGLATVRR
jgi:ribonuclease PH